MLLAIDIGNTNITCGLFRSSRLLRTWDLEHADLAGSDSLGVDFEGLEGASMCSVVPSVNERAIAACKQAFGVSPLVVGVQNAGMKVAGYDGKQLGIDRLVAAISAYERYGKPVIVIDAGTAITVDLVNARGRFIGGVIVPGLGTAASSLHGVAEQLPLVKLCPSRRVRGRDTRSAINSGIVNGYAGLVDHIVRELSREAKLKPIVVATGGDAKLLKKVCRSIDHIHSHLVLEGLNIVWRRDSQNIR